MKVEKIDGLSHIYVEDGESEQDVLRAIAKASFELSRPAGLGFMSFDEDAGELTDEDADQFIHLSASPGSVLYMDYVGGRQCKTFVYKDEDGHLKLNDKAFECDRGEVTPLFDLAEEILSNHRSCAPLSDNGLRSTTFMYEGESLDKRLRDHGFERLPDESDWDFRKRTFPGMMKEDPVRAMEFLLGCSAAEWDALDRMLAYHVMSRENPDEKWLKLFASQFAGDPLIRRKRKQTAPDN